MILNLGPAGEHGLVQDRPYSSLPLNAFTIAENVVFRDGVARRVAGYAAAYTPEVAPYNAFFVNVPSGPFWVYPGLAEVWATDGTTHEEITKTATTYNATADLNWNGGPFGGLLVLNNGVDAVPQVWIPTSLAVLLIDLANWPASTSARIIRPYKSRLVAMDLTESSVRYPHVFRWSHPADPGAVPASWDYTDPTYSAGRTETPFRDTNDFFVDAATLRDILVVYKGNSTWGVQETFDEFTYRFYKIFDSIGLIAPRCAVEFRSGQHFAVALDDIIVHDGQQAQSILNTRLRRAVFNDIDYTKFVRNFVLVDWPNSTCMFFYVGRGASFCNRVLLWNFAENTLALRDVDPVAGGAVGQVSFSAVGLTWDSDSGSWDSDTTSWDFSAANPRDRRLLLASPTEEALYGFPYGLSKNGVAFTSTLERTKLGIPVRTGQPPDFTAIKQFRRIWPHIEGEAGQEIRVYVGAQDSIEGSPTWQGPFTFTIGSSEWIDVMVTGRLLAYRLESVGSFSWALSSVEVDVVFRGSQ